MKLFTVTYYNDDGLILLGTYDSKEKALETIAYSLIEREIVVSNNYHIDSIKDIVINNYQIAETQLNKKSLDYL